MKKIFVCLALVAPALSIRLAAQTVESIPFRAVLRPENEVPPVRLDASGTATVWLHIVRDGSGRIVSGSADFDVNYRFPGVQTFTGLHIHRGAAGTNGPVTIDSALRTRENAPASGQLFFQGQILPENAAALATATDMLTNPAGFYVNLHTREFPGGAIRGQLERAQMRVLLSQMNPGNEVPAITGLNATGLGAAVLLYTTNPSGVLTSASVNLRTTYTGFPAGTRFTGFHIHRGVAGTNGPVTIDSGIRGGDAAIAAPESGAGTLDFTTEVDVTNAAQVNTVYDIVNDPAAFYLNLHTMVNPGGAIRGQTRSTDRISFQQTLVPGNEVPPVTNLNATGHSAFTLWAIRDGNGLSGAYATFDVNHRFPGETTFTGLHIHNGAAGTNGPVTIDSGIRAPGVVTSMTGFGNIYRDTLVVGGAALATANTLLANPELAYVNLHTMVNPGGAVRAQVAEPATGGPRIDRIISAVSDPSYDASTPGGLVAIYGRDLARSSSTGGGFETPDAPASLNGTRVIIGNRGAAVLSVDPRVVVAQVPVESTIGDAQPVYVLTPAGPSNTVGLRILRAAPGVFFDTILPQGNRAVVFRMSDFSYVTNENPARGGEAILIPMIGLGPVNPPLVTGQAGNNGDVVTAPQITIGGQPTRTMTAYAVPGMVGVYWVSVNVPTGLPAGLVPLVVRTGDAASNATVIPVR